MKKPSKAAVDKLIEEWKDRGQQVENLKTQVRNLENCVAAIVIDQGHENTLHITERTLKALGGENFALTWDRCAHQGIPSYEIQLCLEHGNS